MKPSGSTAPSWSRGIQNKIQRIFSSLRITVSPYVTLCRLMSPCVALCHLMSPCVTSGLVYALGSNLENAKMKIMATSYELLGLSPLVKVQKSTCPYDEELFPLGNTDACLLACDFECQCDVMCRRQRKKERCWIGRLLEA